MQVQRMNVSELKLDFESVTDYTVTTRVAAVLAKEHKDWNAFASDIKRVFKAQDSTKVTVDSFLSWVHAPKNQPLDLVLSEFELKYNELTLQEQQRCASKTMLFVQSAPEQDKRALIKKFKTTEGELTD